MISECSLMAVIWKTKPHVDRQPATHEAKGSRGSMGGSSCIVCLTNRMLPHMFSHFLFISKEGKEPVGGEEIHFFAGEQRSYEHHLCVVFLVSFFF